MITVFHDDIGAFTESFDADYDNYHCGRYPNNAPLPAIIYEIEIDKYRVWCWKLWNQDWVYAKSWRYRREK